MISRVFNVARQNRLRVFQEFEKRFLVSSNYKMDESSASNIGRNFSSSTSSHANKLISERSPYLLQHARNPVNWYAWNDEALAKAKAENKLIFLSVGYSTCHWCHVMERESFENESIASIMNEHFINIKVDREERPDIDRVYMTFVQLASGSGGWPMSVFLTPDLHPVAGGTYFAPEDRWGRPGFKSVLMQMSKRWREKPEELREIGTEVINSLKKVSAFEVGLVSELTGGAVPEIQCADMCMQQLSNRFDSEFGGFSYAPKFPQPCNLMFLFHYYSRNPTGEHNKTAYNMALLTLEKMSKGGIHDHIGQGFARYSTDEKWHVPHFEKMLYDQAQLVVAYATAYLLSERKIFRDVVEDILSYVEHNLSHTQGGLYSAEDADSLPTHESVDKLEGAFYVWTLDEVESLLSQPLSCKNDVLLCDIFCHHYNIRAQGNVDPSNDPHGELLDKNVLIVLGSEKETAEKFGISEKELSDELKTAHQILFDERNKRPRPHLDDKIVLSWNGLMLSAYAKAAQILQNSSYKARAVKIADFIRKYLSLKDSNRLLHCCYVDENTREVTQSKNIIHGFLNDYAFLIRGLLDLYECTYDSTWIEWAEKLQDIQNQLFWDSSAKAFNLGSPEYHFSTILVKDDEDGAEPSGNSVTVQNLLRLSALLERSDYHEKAEQILSVFTSRLSRFPSSLPEMSCGLMFLHDSPTQIYVVESKDNLAQEMLSAVQQFYIPNRVLMLINEANPLFYQKSEIVKNMVDSAKDVTAVHICRNRVCSLPVTTVESLKSSLKSN